MTVLQFPENPRSDFSLNDSWFLIVIDAMKES